MQYTGQTNVQTLTFSAIPASGNFKFTYCTVLSDDVAWNANNGTIASVLEDLTGISGITVTGGLSTGTIVVTLGNSPALILGTTLGTLEDSFSNPITSLTSGSLIKAAGTIQALAKLQVMNQLPSIVANAFNLIPTVQTLTFSAPPSTGAFQIQLSVTSTPSIGPTATAAIPFGASNLDIRNAIMAILPSGSVTVTGGLADGEIELTFTGVNPTVILISSNTTAQTIVVTTNLAFGTQLDTLGKYAGVTRQGNTPSGPVTLNDTDFYTLIQLAIIRNSFGSSLSVIGQLLFNFFQNQISVYDHRNMQMSYVISTSGSISLNLIYVMISQGLLPKPMGVQLAVVIAVSNTFLFSFRTYDLPAAGAPFNTYDDYELDWPWVTYSDAIGV
jgi:hypothetical protein